MTTLLRDGSPPYLAICHSDDTDVEFGRWQTMNMPFNVLVKLFNIVWDEVENSVEIDHRPKVLLELQSDRAKREWYTKRVCVRENRKIIDVSLAHKQHNNKNVYASETLYLCNTKMESMWFRASHKLCLMYIFYTRFSSYLSLSLTQFRNHSHTERNVVHIHVGTGLC